MNINGIQKYISAINRGWDKIISSRPVSMLRPVLGMPLFYFGVFLLVLHFFLHWQSNTVLIVAMVCELLGVAGHYREIQKIIFFAD